MTGGQGGSEEYVDPANIDRAASDFDTESQNLARAVGQLTSSLQPLDGCWGTDDPGQAFGTKYQAHASDMVSAANSLVTGLGDIAQRLTQHADYIRQLASSYSVDPTGG